MLCSVSTYNMIADYLLTAVLYTVLRAAGCRPGIWSLVALFAVSFLLRIYCAELRGKRDRALAREKLGTFDFPHVKGLLPGNVDILYQAETSASTTLPAQTFSNLTSQ